MSKHRLDCENNEHSLYRNVVWGESFGIIYSWTLCDHCPYVGDRAVDMDQRTPQETLQFFDRIVISRKNRKPTKPIKVKGRHKK